MYAFDVLLFLFLCVSLRFTLRRLRWVLSSASYRWTDYWFWLLAHALIIVSLCFVLFGLIDRVGVELQSGEGRVSEWGEVSRIKTGRRLAHDRGRFVHDSSGDTFMKKIILPEGEFFTVRQIRTSKVLVVYQVGRMSGRVYPHKVQEQA